MTPSPKVFTLVQARMGSQRFPGKALKPLAGRPMITHVLERAGLMGWPVMLVTTDQAKDEGIVRAAGAVGVPVFRGSERDVLGRMAAAAASVKADVVVRVTGDCPCFCPDVGRDVVERYLADPSGIVSNDTSRSGWPDGLDVEVFSGELLARADAEVPPYGSTDRNAQHDREHVTPWIRRRGDHRILPNWAGENWLKVKLSVDVEADYERVQEVHRWMPEGTYGWFVLRSALLNAGLANGVLL